MCYCKTFKHEINSRAGILYNCILKTSQFFYQNFGKDSTYFSFYNSQKAVRISAYFVSDDSTRFIVKHKCWTKRLIEILKPTNIYEYYDVLAEVPGVARV